MWREDDTDVSVNKDRMPVCKRRFIVYLEGAEGARGVLKVLKVLEGC